MIALEFDFLKICGTPPLQSESHRSFITASDENFLNTRAILLKWESSISFFLLDLSHAGYTTTRNVHCVKQ